MGQFTMTVCTDGKRDTIENIMTGIRYTASEHVKNMDTAYKLFKEENKTDYEQSSSYSRHKQ